MSTTDGATGRSGARHLLLMGSGELTPTMAKAHRNVIERLGGAPLPCAFLDTPFAFQENAAELAERAVTYFHERLRSPLAVASLGRAVDGDADPFAAERATGLLRSARYVFAGPGSPSYALGQWRASVVPPLLVEKLRHGGALGFASAAALTLGAFTIPVYEIYKVGQPPHWLEGLDVLSVLGWRAALVPHFDNAEGGTHDTRYCYLGERRLRLLEDELPDDAFILGLDEHTALSCDLDAGQATVSGRGQLTLRRRGTSVVVAAGETLEIAEIASRALALGASPTRSRRSTPPAPAAAPAFIAAEEEFGAALAARAPGRAIAALLALESAAAEDGAGSLARPALRSLLLQLEEPLADGLGDVAETIAPYVEFLLELRATARAEGRFALSDEIRDRLTALGVEVRDTPAGPTWLLAGKVHERAE